jgi:hypothetical protein
MWGEPRRRCKPEEARPPRTPVGRTCQEKDAGHRRIDRPADPIRRGVPSMLCKPGGSRPPQLKMRGVPNRGCQPPCRRPPRALFSAGRGRAGMLATATPTVLPSPFAAGCANDEVPASSTSAAPQPFRQDAPLRRCKPGMARPSCRSHSLRRAKGVMEATWLPTAAAQVSGRAIYQLQAIARVTARTPFAACPLVHVSHPEVDRRIRGVPGTRCKPPDRRPPRTPICGVPLTRCKPTGR